MRFTYFFLLLSISILIGLTNCRKENFLTDSGAKVEFSKDTVVFDTVFVTIGSTYERFTIKNPQNKALNLSSVRLANGTRSSFRMNVDGLSGVNIKDIEIPAKDSVFVFVEVTIDPNNQNNPFVIEDDIIVTVNGNEQSVHLAAWGQNAYFHYEADGFLIICNETWLNDKPHVLYGITALDSACTLDIQPGTQIYGHSGAMLYIYKSTLNVNGDPNNRVLFQGDRREASFNDVPGQWFGVRFFAPQNSLINNTLIKNATAGIYIDTFAAPSQTLTINNSQSINNSFASLFAQGANIRAENSQFGKAGTNSVALRLGGNYYFNHCTIDNYWTSSTRNSPALVINNYFESGGTTIVRSITAFINNTIIYGNNDNEIVLDTFPTPGQANYLFNTCIYKTDEPINSNFAGGFLNTDPKFKNSSSRELQSNSPARNNADNSPGLYLSLDIQGNMRSNPAAIGCFENP